MCPMECQYSKIKYTYDTLYKKEPTTELNPGIFLYSYNELIVFLPF